MNDKNKILEQVYIEKHFSDIQTFIDNGLILVATATKIETDALHCHLQSISGGILEVKKGNSTYFIAQFGKYLIAHVECGDMGSTSSMGSIITISNAIDFLKPKFVMMVGIAFGIDDSKQNIGDILVSKTILPYEIQRVGERNIQRGTKPEASNYLRDCFKNIKGWEYLLPNDKSAKLEVCDILSGEKLVDNIIFRKELEIAFPTAKGGEMEGTGLYVACQEKKVDWILVKGICDFADGNKNEGKKEKQLLAIQTTLNACLFLFNKEYIFEGLGVTPYLRGPIEDTKDTISPLTGHKYSISIALLESDQIPELFELLDAENLVDKFQYTRFKKEYGAGLKGIDLIDWKDRMKVFVRFLIKIKYY